MGRILKEMTTPFMLLLMAFFLISCIIVPFHSFAQDAASTAAQVAAGVSGAVAAPTVAIAIPTTTVWSWVISNWGMLASVLFGMSESLALIPGIKSNSVFQLAYNVLGWLRPKSV
jgi:hypothetical protein